MRYLAVALLLAAFFVAPAQSPAPTAGELVNQIVANELADRLEQHKWMYMVEKRDGNHTLTEEQVETKDGPFYRLLAIDGIALDSDHLRQENARIDRLLHDPAEQLKVKRAHDEDERKLETLMRLMPAAFLYEYDGAEGDLLKIKFRPNPAYVPPTYEARVAHCLAGTLLIDPQQQRLAKLAGQLTSPVEFGYGLLGRIDSGGTVALGRIQVGPLQWKTRLIDFRVSGRLVLFKTISKQQYEIRSNFGSVPGDISLSEANDLAASQGLMVMDHKSTQRSSAIKQ